MEQTKNKPTLEDALKIPTAKYVGKHDNLMFVECPECNIRMLEGNYPEHYDLKHKQK